MRIASLAIVAMLLSVAGCRQDAPAVAAASMPAATAPGAPVAPATDAGADAAPVAVDSAAATPDDHAAVNAAIDNVLGDHAPYEQAIAAFQSAVRTDDHDAVAAMVAYPFTAHINDIAVRIPDADAFVARYGEIVTPPIAGVIAQQRYADLFVNAKGVMFGNGEAWINGICADAACAHPDVRVVAIQPAQ